MTYFLFILLGFVLGSTLFAYWIPRLFFKTDITKVPPDHNPGVANAYMQAGFFAGTLSLLCELFKGAVPVFLADRILDRDSMLFALVMAAPVFGHAFPFFQKERGGKAIAVSFRSYDWTVSGNPSIILSDLLLYFILTGTHTASAFFPVCHHIRTVYADRVPVCTGKFHTAWLFYHLSNRDLPPRYPLPR